MITTLTSREWFFLLKSMKVQESIFYIPADIRRAEVMEGYCRVRRQWMEKGYVTLDLDGHVQPGPELERTLWNVGEWRKITRLEQDGAVRLFLEGPVDILQVDAGTGTSGDTGEDPATGGPQEGELTLGNLRYREWYRVLREEIYEPACGVLRTLWREQPGEIRTDLDHFPGTKKELAEELARHLLPPGMKEEA